MAALAGRKVRIKIGSTAIASAISDSATINREHIDITNKDSLGLRTLLGSDIGLWSMDMSCNGILTTDDLILWAEDETEILKSLTFEIDGIGSFTGQFGMTSFEPGGEDGANAATFSAAFSSSGAIPFTAVTP